MRLQARMFRRKPYWEFVPQGSVVVIIPMSGTRGSKPLLRSQGALEVQAVLRNGQTLLRERVENGNAYVKKILSTALLVLPSGLSFTRLCLLAFLRSWMWTINHVGSCDGDGLTEKCPFAQTSSSSNTPTGESTSKGTDRP